jgi:VanZ family protein
MSADRRSSARPKRPAPSHPRAAILPRELARARRHKLRGIAKRFAIDNVAPMRPVQTSFRTLTWCCVILLAILSLLPAEDMMRTGMPSKFEHFLAYAGSASIAIAGYGRLGSVRVIGLFWMYASVLEYLQHFSRGRHPSVDDFAASALGAFIGGLAAALLMRRLRQRTCSDIV